MTERWPKRTVRASEELIEKEDAQKATKATSMDVMVYIVLDYTTNYAATAATWGLS